MCITLAKPGKCSPSIIPGTEDAIGLNSPRISAGASGFISHMSRWLEPPFKKITMQESARGLEDVEDRFIEAFKIFGRVNPAIPAAPTVNNCLRLRLFLNKGINVTIVK